MSDSARRRTELTQASLARAAAAAEGRGVRSGRGVHSFTLQLNFSNSRTRSCVKSGYTVDR